MLSTAFFCPHVLLRRRQRAHVQRFCAAAAITLTALTIVVVISRPAHAQSSVEMYGRIDGGIEYLNHLAQPNGTNASRWSAESGDWGTSMWGMRGTEDLGGGLNALFDLETAFQVMNGMTGGNGRLFSRRAYVGLNDSKLGQIQAGRNLFIDSDGVWAFDPFVQQAVSSASLVRGRNWQQTNNNVEYHSPIIGGFDVQTQFAFGNQTSFNTGAPGEFGRSNGVMLTWHSPALEFRGIYDELRNSNGQMDNIFTASREYFLGANINVDPVKVQAAWTHYAAPDTPAGLADTANYYWLGATLQATTRWAVTAAGFYVNVPNGGGDATHDPAGHATLYALGTTYNFSKRTFFYATVAYVRNSANATFSVFANPRGSTPNTSPLAGESQTGAYMGIMSNF
jgi:predicted porin